MQLSPRYLIVATSFLATFVMYAERVGFSIAFTAMAKSAIPPLDESVKGRVLSAFYWGYAVSQVPGGWAAQQYGGRVTLIISFLLWSIVSILTPTDGKRTAAIMLARVCVGMAQGFIIPSIHTVLSQWIPPHERARAVSLTTSGMYLGSAASMLILPSVSLWFGASSLLQFDGGLGLAWLMLWLLVGREIPHRGSVIPLTAQDVQSNREEASTGKGRPGPTPWRRMMSSPAIWAIIVNNFSFHYAFYVIMNWLPTYFNSVLKVELASLGGMKTLPYLVMFLMSNVGGLMGDRIILRWKKSVAEGRKYVNTIGFIASAIALMVMPAAGGVTSGVAATTLTLGALGFARGGFSVNHMDVAPKYAGVVMGISNTAGTLSGVIGVAVTGMILDRFEGGAENIAGWYCAHSLCAVICVSAMFVFLGFARGERLFE